MKYRYKTAGYEVERISSRKYTHAVVYMVKNRFRAGFAGSEADAVKQLPVYQRMANNSQTAFNPVIVPVIVIDSEYTKKSRRSKIRKASKEYF